jgi:hypothetical protein
MQLNVRLLVMQKTWVQTQSGPFPKRLHSALMDLQAALEIEKAETVTIEALVHVAEEAVERTEQRETRRKKSKKCYIEEGMHQGTEGRQ